MQPPGRLGLLAGPVHKLGVECGAARSRCSLFGPATTRQSGLVRPSFQAQQIHQHSVFAHPLGIGQRGSPLVRVKSSWAMLGDGRKTGAGAFARVQRGFFVQALPEIKAAAEGINEHLAAVGGGLVGVGQLDVQFWISAW